MLYLKSNLTASSVLLVVSGCHPLLSYVDVLPVELLSGWVYSQLCACDKSVPLISVVLLASVVPSISFVPLTDNQVTTMRMMTMKAMMTNNDGFDEHGNEGVNETGHDDENDENENDHET